MIRAVGGFYYVKTAERIYECKARNFRRNGSIPLVGDRVEISLSRNGYPAVEEILPRKNALVRPPIANLDILIIVCPAVFPSPKTLLADKMIAAAVYNDITPVIVVTKNDLKDASRFAEIYRKSGITAIVSSAVTGEGIDEIKALIKNKITAFTGNSGAGKSTLLNTLFPQLALQTGEISKKLGRGRHTTRTVELFEADGGYVADTPGFSTLDIERLTAIRKEELPYCFTEFEKYFNSCRFASCTHICEKGCAVIQAVNEGKIQKSRHESYVEMYNEVKDIKDWERKVK